MKNEKRVKSVLVITLFTIYCMASATAGLAAEVDMGLEGAYTDSDLVVYIYADINAAPILSYGVKLSYNPAELSTPVAEKNEAVWFFGDGVNNEPYMDPEVDTEAGEVTFIGGKLDTSDLEGGSALSGVSGNRVLLGKVVFTRTGAGTDFGLHLAVGRDDGPGGYDNFVANDGRVLDAGGVAFTPLIVVKRGDANADGFIDNKDYIAIRSAINSRVYRCFADCDGDGFITSGDYACLRSQL